MKSYIKLLIAVVAVLAAVFVGSNIVLNNTNEDGGGRPYRVEAERIALKIKNGEAYNLSDYKYIKSVEKQSDEFESGDSDYLVKQIGGTLYRFDYSYHSDNSKAIGMFNICFIVLSAVLIAVLVLVYFRVIRPFRTISDYPTELAKGNLTMPLKQGRGGYFGKFLWGLDLLREKLEAQKKSELELKKKNKSLVLSLSHDIKTPLGVIELYSKALEKGLYKEEEKKKRIAQSINEKCDDIKSYVDGIIKASNDEIINEEVNLTEFYLSELISQCESFYADKLRLLKIDFEISSYSDCMLSGDPDRALEVLQNLIENAIKYGDGNKISISFDREDECQLVSVHNGGCTLSDSELPHIFDSFWRGSNVGSNSGSGLGLYICRQLMRKMNGDIFAEIKDNEMIVTAVFPLA